MSWGTGGWGRTAWGGRGLEAPPPTNVAVLTGFAVEYQSGDFELESVATTFTLTGFSVLYQHGTLVHAGDYQWTKGTVDLVEDSAVVRGVGTDWLGSIESGDLFAAFFSDDVRAAVIYETAAVQDNYELTLTAPWRGPSGEGVPYLIHRAFGSPMVVTPDAFTVLEGSDADLDVLANDSGLRNRQITIVEQPDRGAVAVIDNGAASARVRWFDDGTGGGTTQFSYSVDGSVPTVVSLSIEALPVVEPPVFIAGGTGNTRNSTANACTPAYPANLENGDLLLGVFSINDRGSSPGFGAVPSGWTLLQDASNGELATRLIYKFATGGETGTISQAWSSGDAANDLIAGRIYAFRNVDGIDPVDGLATPLLQGSGTGTINMVGVTTEDPSSLALAIISGTFTGGSIGDSTGESGGDWSATSNQFGSGTVDGVGFDFCSAEMAEIGTISGGTVTVGPGSPTQKSIIQGFALAPGSAVVGRFVDAVAGSDANPGTEALPWKTLAHAQTQLVAGDTLWLRGGKYFGPINWSKSGTLGNEISVRSYPGELATITLDRPEFQTIGNSQWTLHDAGTETYRSVGSQYTASAYIGSFHTTGRGVGTLCRLPSYQTLTALMSTTYTWQADGEYYRGPGIHLGSDGHIYCRLQNLASPRDAGVPTDYESVHPLGDMKNIPPTAGGFVPSSFVINLSPSQDLFTINASHLLFSRIAFEGGERGIVFSNSTHVTVERCRIWGQRINVRMPGSNSDLTFRHNDLDTGVPPWISWNEVKIDDAHNPGMKLTHFISDNDNNTNVLIEENLLRSTFDGMATPGVGPKSFLRNTSLFMFDDFVQFGGGLVGLEVGWNFICGGGPGYNGGPSDSTASKFFHHNVIDIRRGEFGYRVGQTGDGTAWRKSHAAFPTHSPGGSNTPAKIYNNTILHAENINLQGCRIQRVGDKTAGLHEVYNNICIQRDDREYVRGVTVGATDQILDFNLIHRTAVGATFPLFNDWPNGSGGQVDYADLAAWLASAGFTETQSVYAAGFENSSKQGDPELTDLVTGWPATPGLCDYRPSAIGIAATGAKDLSATGWPGATSAAWFGAVDPAASTGLGAVGIPAGVAIGP